MDPDSPEELAGILAQAAEGDQEAWRHLVDAFAPRVFGLLRVQCRDPELAEEIAQSAFCTIAQKLGEYEEHGRFESWLFRIAMNRLRDEMRRRKRQARPMEDEKMVGLVGGVEDPSSEFDAADRAALADAVGKLSEKDREVIDLRHVGGLSFRQIGELLGVPVGTLLARHHRALSKIRDLMESPSEAPEEGGKGTV